MKLYLDSCCYNRPFDDLNQERIYLESEAVLRILQKGRDGEYEIIGSDGVEFELNRIQDQSKRQKVLELYEMVQTRVELDDNIEIRSRQIREQSNIRMFDSLQLAFAEAAQADVVLTTDDKLEKMASHLQLGVRVTNPLKFIMEILYER